MDKTKLSGTTFEISFGVTPKTAAALHAARQLGVRMGRAIRPWNRAERIFDFVWKSFIVPNKLDDWELIHDLALHFHPDYCYDQDTREWLPNCGGGGVVFEQMEWHQYEPGWIAATSPTLWAILRKAGVLKSRGKSRSPEVFHQWATIISACLVCHQFAQLEETYARQPIDEAKFFEQLAYLERFAGTYRAYIALTPATVKTNQKRREQQKEWLADLVRFHQDRLAKTISSGHSATPRHSSEVWVKRRASKGINSPSFEVAYKGLLKAIKGPIPEQA